MRLLHLAHGEPEQSIRELLTQNIIGTPGKSMVYQQLCVSQKLDHIPDPYFLSVRLGQKVVGTSCFIRRPVAVANLKREAFYIRYFAFRNRFRSQNDALERLHKKSVLRSEVEEVLNGAHFDLTGQPLCYAYVDPGNIRSLRIIMSFGFRNVGSFKTVFFSRFSPVLSSNVESVKGNTKEEVFRLIREAYSKHAFYTEENIGYADGLYVLRKEGKVLAALQANPEHWHVHELPGSRHLINVVSRVPYVRRLFHRDFRFLSIEGLYVRSGYENTLEELIEGVLALTRRHTAIMCLDPSAPEYDLVRQLDRGFIRHLTNEKELHVMARGPKEVLSQIEGMPIYVSAFDNM